MRPSQQDCSSAPSNCICWPRACSKTTALLDEMTHSSTVVQTLESSTVTMTMTSPTPSTAAETTTLFAPTTVSSAETTNSSAAVGSTTLGAMTDTQASNGDIALIGGIVGGVVALLLMLAFLVVARNRLNSARPANQNDVALASAHVRASSSHYGKINAEPAASGYGSLGLSPPSGYNDPSVLANNSSSNYVIVSTKPTNSTHYVDPGVLRDDL
jgi:hypothetical protein